MLYLMLLFILVLLLLMGAIFKFAHANSAYFRLKCQELKYELIYQQIGFMGVLEDKRTKVRNNKIVLPSASGKTVLITGGTRGIGLEVVKALVKLDANVIIGCRNPKAAEELLQKLRESGVKTGNLQAFPLDTSSLNSVRSFARLVKERFSKINILINNAGIMFGPYKESEDGFENQLATNYLGHFMLTHLLLQELKAGGTDKLRARIVNVSSAAHQAADLNFENFNSKKSYISSLAYANSKFAQILFSNHLNTLFTQTQVPVAVYSVHPGIVNTDLFNGTPLKKFGSWIIPLLFKAPEEGSKPILYASLSDIVEKLGGSYISNCEIIPPIASAFSTTLQKKLFDFTNDLLKIREFGKEN